MNLTSISYFDNNQSGYVKFVWSYIFIKFQNGEENLIITNELTSIIYYIQNGNNQSGIITEIIYKKPRILNIIRKLLETFYFNDYYLCDYY